MDERDEHMHVLRNPWGHSEQRVREARLWAADRIEELEREPKGPVVDAQTVRQDAVDAVRYRFLRNSVRNANGGINEKLYVRCDDRYRGWWWLDDVDLDMAIDSVLAEPKAG